MHLIQILLPLNNPDGTRIPGAQFEDLTKRLTEQFGGATSFARAPGEGLWDDGSKTEKDDIVVVEVMSEALDRAYWAGLRKELEVAFHQDEIVIRAQVIERL